MTCSDVQRVLPEVLDGAPDKSFQNSSLHNDFKSHLKSCPDCSDLVSDLKFIWSEARQLEEAEPAPRVWVRIAAELRAEGIIREIESAPVRPGRTSAGLRWSAWWLAPVAAVLLVAGSFVVSHRSEQQVADKQAHPMPVASPAAGAPVVVPEDATIPEDKTGTPPAVPSMTASLPGRASAPTALPQRTAKRSGNSGDKAGTAVATAVEPAPSAEDQQFLSEVSTRAPSMRATYENQLQAVNNDIRDVQTYLKLNPGDADARQHLMDAYQEKALLYQMALEHIQ